MLLYNGRGGFGWHALTRSRLLGLSFYEADCVAYGFDFFGFFVGDCDAEFFFKIHDEFNGVEGVCAEVGDETCFGNNLFGFYTEFLYYNGFNAICNF